MSIRSDRGFSLRLNINFGSRISEKLLSRKFQDLEETLEAVKENRIIRVYYVRSQKNQTTQVAEEIFSLELSDEGPFFAFSFNMKDKKIYVFDVYVSSSRHSILVAELDFLETGIQGSQNQKFFDKICNEMAQSSAPAVISDALLYRVWEKYSLIEEAIIEKIKRENFRLLVSGISSNKKDNFIIKIVKTKQDVIHKLEADFSLVEVTEEGEDKVTKGFHLVKRISSELIQITHRDPAMLELLTTGAVLKEDISGRSAEVGRKKRAFETLVNDRAANKDLKKLLVYPGQIKGAQEKFPLVAWHNAKLELETKQVITEALSSPSIYLIQGPPGTGKTTTISEICNQATANGKRVLIAGQTNLAIDNVIERIQETNALGNSRILRVGPIEKIGLASAQNRHISSLIDGISQGSKVAIEKFLEEVHLRNEIELKGGEIPTLKAYSAQNDQLQKIVKENAADQVQLDLLQNQIGKFDPESKRNLQLEGLLSSVCLSEEDAKVFLLLIHGGISTTRLSTYESLNIRRGNEEVQELNVQKLLGDHRSNRIKFKTHVASLPALVEKLKKRKEGGIWNWMAVTFGESNETIERKISEIKSELHDLKVYEARILELEAKLGEIKASRERLRVDINTYCGPEKTSSYDYCFCRKPVVEKCEIYLVAKLVDVLDLTTWIPRNHMDFRRVCDDFQNAKLQRKRSLVLAEELRGRMLKRSTSIHGLEADLRQARALIDPLLNHLGVRKEPQDLTPAEIETISDWVGALAFWAAAKDLEKSYTTFIADVAKSGDRDLELIKEFIIQDVNVVAATCSQSASMDFQSIPGDYDYVIIDEASKALPTELFIPLVHGKKIILVGDHRQLAPYIDREVKETLTHEEREIVEVPLFEKLFNQVMFSNKSTLITQYRMPDSLARIVSKLFYENKLVSSQSVSQEKDVVEFIHCKGEETKIGSSYINKDEANLMITYLTGIAKVIDPRKSIGIISMYRKQAEYLEDTVRAKFPGLDLEIGTVDSFQGREKHLILVSTVRSSNVSEFLKDPRRLNVAISRSKERLIIFGNREVLNRSDLFSQLFAELQTKKAA